MQDNYDEDVYRDPNHTGDSLTCPVCKGSRVGRYHVFGDPPEPCDYCGGTGYDVGGYDLDDSVAPPEDEQQSGLVECPQCGGRGYAAGWYEPPDPCPYCDGSGLVDAFDALIASPESIEMLQAMADEAIAEYHEEPLEGEDNHD